MMTDCHYCGHDAVWHDDGDDVCRFDLCDCERFIP